MSYVVLYDFADMNYNYITFLVKLFLRVLRKNHLSSVSSPEMQKWNIHIYKVFLCEICYFWSFEFLLHVNYLNTTQNKFVIVWISIQSISNFRFLFVWSYFCILGDVMYYRCSNVKKKLNLRELRSDFLSIKWYIFWKMFVNFICKKRIMHEDCLINLCLNFIIFILIIC